MYLEERDILLLQYLAEHDEPVKIAKESVPHGVLINFEFYGLDVIKHPNSIWVRLFELSKYSLVKSKFTNQWGITEAGRIELRKHIDDTKSIQELLDEPKKQHQIIVERFQENMNDFVGGKKEKWHENWILKNLFWPLLVGVILILLTYWATRK